MRILIVLALLAGQALAQPALTTIIDTVHNNDGTKYNGKLTIQGQSFSSSGNSILQQVKTLTVTNGAINTSLVPNDTGQPQFTSYVFSFANGTLMTCVIPTSSTPITLAPNCTYGSPTPPLSLVLPSQINVIGMTNGVYCISVLNGVASLSQNCPGGAGAPQLSTLTNGQLSSLTNSTLLSLTN